MSRRPGVYANPRRGPGPVRRDCWRSCRRTPYGRPRRTIDSPRSPPRLPRRVPKTRINNRKGPARRYLLSHAGGCRACLLLLDDYLANHAGFEVTGEQAGVVVLTWIGELPAHFLAGRQTRWSKSESTFWWPGGRGVGHRCPGHGASIARSATTLGFKCREKGPAAGVFKVRLPSSSTSGTCFPFRLQAVTRYLSPLDNSWLSRNAVD